MIFMIAKVIYSGVFDPLTYGHLDIVTRTSKIFDEIFLAIAESQESNFFFFERAGYFCKESY